MAEELSEIAPAPAMAEEGEGPAIGIDFGMSNARVGVWLHGRVEIIPNEDGSRATPAFVTFTDAHAQFLVGQAAKDRGIIDPTKVSFGAKRFLDAKYNDHTPLTDFNNRGPRGNNSLQHYSAELISTFILMKLRSTAERFLNRAVKDAVIAVPSYFNTFQRHAIKDAATKAGLNLIRIVSEPSAAAIAYASNGVDAGNVLVFDLGGGCFGVSILTIHENGSWIEVKANAGDAQLGGEEFDNRMLAYFVEEFKKVHKGKDIGLDPRALWRLKTACEDAKKTLSVTDWVSMEIPALYQGIDYVLAITRLRFEELNRDLLGRCMLLVEKCLREAALDKRSIDHVVLVGGSSKIPRVATLLHSLFDRKELLRVIDPEEAVACGAAILAADLHRHPGAPPRRRLSELTTASIGLERWGGIMSVVIPRNSRFPGKWAVPIEGIHDLQRAFPICVYESEASHTMRGNLQGFLVFRKLHPVPMGVPKLLACLELDANGILGLVAEDLQSGKRKSSIINKDMLRKQMNKHAPRSAEDDDSAKINVGLKKHMEIYCCRLEEATRNLAADDKKQIKAAAWRAMLWIEQNEQASDDDYYSRKYEIICMVLEAEKRQLEREERKKLLSKNTLERCCIGLKNFLNDAKMTSKTLLSAEGATEQMIRWLDGNQLAEAHEYSVKMNELGMIYNSIGVEPTDDMSSWLMKMLQRPTG